MADFLTRRGGVWHFVRKVPLHYRQVDCRGLVRQSTKISVSRDRNGREARRIAKGINEDLESYWRGLASGDVLAAQDRYAEARRRAKALGFEYIDSTELLQRSLDEALRRLEMLGEQRLVDEPEARTALLGTATKPSFKLSELFDRYEMLTRAEMNDMSPNQLRIWKNGKKLALSNLISTIGDKRLDEVTNDHVLDYNEWWQGRVIEEKISVKTANKDISHLSRMFKVVNGKHRLGLPDLFAGKRLEGTVNSTREPFATDHIQKMIDSGILMQLNDEARRIFFLIANTGMRLSEAANLNEKTIRLEAPIPFISVKPDGRRIKTEQSERDLPLVGVALEALKLHPKGFPRYADKGAALSATINKFLTVKKLRPSKKHSVYSLRHAFKDRLIAVKAPDSLIESMMGHAGGTPKYGHGPQLNLKLEWLQQIAFKPSRFI